MSIGSMTAVRVNPYSFQRILRSFERLLPCEKIGKVYKISDAAFPAVVQNRRYPMGV